MNFCRFFYGNPFLNNNPFFYGRSQISELIKKFGNNDSSLGDYAWDDFTSADLRDPYEKFVQKLVYFVESYFPAKHKNEWCNEEGGKALVRLSEAISSDSLPFPPTKEEVIALGKNQIPSRYKEIILGN